MRNDLLKLIILTMEGSNPVISTKNGYRNFI